MEKTHSESGLELSPAKRRLKIAGLATLGFFAFLVLTVLQISSQRIESIVMGHLASQLSQVGYSITAQETDFSLLRGLRLALTSVTLRSRSDADQELNLDSIIASPSWTSLLKGRGGADFDVQLGKESIAGVVEISPSKFWIDLSSDGVDLGKAGILEMIAKLKGTGLVKLDIDLNGDLKAPHLMTGTIGAELKGFKLDAQSLMGFAIPALQISTGKIDLPVTAGKVQFKTFQLGQTALTADDIYMQVTGDMTLNKALDFSTLNLKTNLRFSKKVTDSFSLLDALLTPAKTADGSYAYSLSGTLQNPVPLPLGTSAPATPSGTVAQ